MTYELEMVNKLATVLENVETSIESDMVLTEGAKFDKYVEMGKNALKEFWKWVMATIENLRRRIKVTFAGKNAILTEDITVPKACVDPGELMNEINGVRGMTQKDKKKIELRKGSKVDLPKILKTFNEITKIKNKKSEDGGISNQLTKTITDILNGCDLIISKSTASVMNKITGKVAQDEIKDGLYKTRKYNHNQKLGPNDPVEERVTVKTVNESADYTNNELAAMLMLEAADLLKEDDILTEGAKFDEFKKNAGAVITACIKKIQEFIDWIMMNIRHGGKNAVLKEDITVSAMLFEDINVDAICQTTLDNVVTKKKGEKVSLDKIYKNLRKLQDYLKKLQKYKDNIVAKEPEEAKRENTGAGLYITMTNILISDAKELIKNSISEKSLMKKDAKAAKAESKEAEVLNNAVDALYDAAFSADSLVEANEYIEKAELLNSLAF